MTDSSSSRSSASVVIAPDGARAVAAAHGAHVTSWVPANDTERLFLSSRSSFAPGVAIRGGIPVIFPQFAALGPLPKHGFARTSEWTPVTSAAAASHASSAAFRLTDSPATRAIWPHTFTAELTVSVGGATLDVSLTVRNTGQDILEFTAALHTYLRVDDVSVVSLRGLDGLRYRDTAAGGIERVQTDRDLSIAGEVDRVYLDAAAPIEIREPGRSMRATMTGFRDAVIWNPGPGADTAFRDMELRGDRRMICVEAAAIGTPVRIEAGDEWTGAQRLTAE